MSETQDAPKDTEADSTEQPAEDQKQDTDATETESPEDERSEAWDPERARKKISKVNSENKALRERATKAEQKAESVDELTRQNTDLGVANLRLEVGYELGLPLSLAKRLQGTTREEMLADAETLVELVAPAKRPASRKPAEALRGGLEPDQEPEETDTSKIAERMFRN